MTALALARLALAAGLLALAVAAPAQARPAPDEALVSGCGGGWLQPNALRVRQAQQPDAFHVVALVTSLVEVPGPVVAELRKNVLLGPDLILARGPAAHPPIAAGDPALPFTSPGALELDTLVPIRAIGGPGEVVVLHAHFALPDLPDLDTCATPPFPLPPA